LIGTTEILIIVGVVILIFGASAIPKLARSLGKARAEFEKGIREGEKDREGAGESEDEEKGKKESRS
jgi:sec-independent protein translocase protein TatA